MRPLFAYSAVVFFISHGVVYPALLRVPDDYATIQAALDAAASGDTVEIAPGTYTGDGNRDIDFKGKGIRLESRAGPEQTIIDCQGTEVDPHRGFSFHSQEDSTAVVSGITIQNGFAPGDPLLDASIGGGILCDSSSPMIINCTIRWSVAMNAGGGVACINGSATLLRAVSFDGNIADNNLDAAIEGYGGAIRTVLSTISARECIYRNNRANLGGAISCRQSSFDLDSCIFVGNTAVTFTAFEPIFPGVGGALHLFLTTSGIQFCTFEANTAEPEDEMYHWGGRGGAVYVYGTNPTFTNCTFYGNMALSARGLNPGEGGGLFLSQASPLVRRCIIAGSVDGEAMHCRDTLSNPTLECTDVVGNAGGDWIGCLAEQADLNGNFSLNPRFCDTVQSDFTLQDNSPCLANNAPCAQLVGAWNLGCVGSGITTGGGIEAKHDFALRGFPNPFNSETEIGFVMATAQHVRLEVIDILGRWQATLLDEMIEGGPHAIQWNGYNENGTRLPSGVYFCRLRAGSSTEVFRLVLVK